MIPARYCGRCSEVGAPDESVVLAQITDCGDVGQMCLPVGAPVPDRDQGAVHQHYPAPLRFGQGGRCRQVTCSTNGSMVR